MKKIIPLAVLALTLIGGAVAVVTISTVPAHAGCTGGLLSE